MGETNSFIDIQQGAAHAQGRRLKSTSNAQGGRERGIMSVLNKRDRERERESKRKKEEKGEEKKSKNDKNHTTVT